MNGIRTKTKGLIFLGLSLLVLGHAVVVIDSARNQSPTWDEIGTPVAGLAQLKTGEIRFDPVQPFLSKLILGFPMFSMGIPLPIDHASWLNRDFYRFGFQVIFRSGAKAQSMILASRGAALVCSILTLLLILFWINTCWGLQGSLLAGACFITTPILLSRASLAQPEMPAYLFTLLALWIHERWFVTGRIQYLIGAGVVSGLALLCKLIALPLLPCFFVLNFFFLPQKISPSKKFLFAILPFSIALLTMSLLYLPWKGGWNGLRTMCQFSFSFSEVLPYYWNGKLITQANSLLSYGAFLIKAPLHILILGASGAWGWWTYKEKRSTILHFVLLAFFSLLTVPFFKQAVSTVQLSTFYLGWIPLAGALPTLTAKKNWASFLILVILIGGAWDVFSVHPNYLAYFNRIVGGPERGFQWLSDSDQDWGQSLPTLSKYLRKQGNPGVLLSYSGSGDPEAYGIHYQDLISPALVSRDHLDHPFPIPTKKYFVVVGAKVLQSEPFWFAWLIQNIPAKTLVGQTFFVYDISNNPEAFHWLSQIYAATQRPTQANWAKKIAIHLSENTPSEGTPTPSGR